MQLFFHVRVTLKRKYYYCRTSRYSIFNSYRFSFIFDLYMKPNIKAFPIDSYLLYKHWSRPRLLEYCVAGAGARADLMKYKTLNEILMSVE